MILKIVSKSNYLFKLSVRKELVWKNTDTNDSLSDQEYSFLFRGVEWIFISPLPLRISSCFIDSLLISDVNISFSPNSAFTGRLISKSNTSLLLSVLRDVTQRTSQKKEKECSTDVTSRHFWGKRCETNQGRTAMASVIPKLIYFFFLPLWASASEFITYVRV